MGFVLLSLLLSVSFASLRITGVVDGPLTGGLPKAIEVSNITAHCHTHVLFLLHALVVSLFFAFFSFSSLLLLCPLGLSASLIVRFGEVFTGMLISTV